MLCLIEKRKKVQVLLEVFNQNIAKVLDVKISDLLEE